MAEKSSEKSKKGIFEAGAIRSGAKKNKRGRVIGKIGMDIEISPELAKMAGTPSVASEDELKTKIAEGDVKSPATAPIEIKKPESPETVKAKVKAEKPAKKKRRRRRGRRKSQERREPVPVAQMPFFTVDGEGKVVVDIREGVDARYKNDFKDKTIVYQSRPGGPFQKVPRMDLDLTIKFGLEYDKALREHNTSEMVSIRAKADRYLQERKEIERQIPEAPEINEKIIDKLKGSDLGQKIELMQITRSKLKDYIESGTYIATLMKERGFTKDQARDLALVHVNNLDRAIEKAGKVAKKVGGPEDPVLSSAVTDKTGAILDSLPADPYMADLKKRVAAKESKKDKPAVPDRTQKIDKKELLVDKDSWEIIDQEAKAAAQAAEYFKEAGRELADLQEEDEDQAFFDEILAEIDEDRETEISSPVAPETQKILDEIYEPLTTESARRMMREDMLTKKEPKKMTLAKKISLDLVDSKKVNTDEIAEAIQGLQAKTVEKQGATELAAVAAAQREEALRAVRAGEIDLEQRINPDTPVGQAINQVIKEGLEKNKAKPGLKSILKERLKNWWNLGIKEIFQAGQFRTRTKAFADNIAKRYVEEVEFADIRPGRVQADIVHDSLEELSSRLSKLKTFRGENAKEVLNKKGLEIKAELHKELNAARNEYREADVNKIAKIVRSAVDSEYTYRYVVGTVAPILASVGIVYAGPPILGSIGKFFAKKTGAKGLVTAKARIAGRLQPEITEVVENITDVSLDVPTTPEATEQVRKLSTNLWKTVQKWFVEHGHNPSNAEILKKSKEVAENSDIEVVEWGIKGAKKVTELAEGYLLYFN